MKYSKNFKIVFKQFSMLLILLFGIHLLITLPSCSSQPVFEGVVICEQINENTFEPLVLKTSFKTSATRIFSTVRYQNVTKNDTYFFKWVNVSSGEELKTKVYTFSPKTGYKSGYVVSVFENREKNTTLMPGRYMVEFYNNEILQSTGTFEIKEQEPAEISQMKILSIDFSDSVNELLEPLSIKSKFAQTDTVYACIKLNFLVKGSSVNVQWFNEDGGMVLESEHIIEKDKSNPAYISFGFQSSKGIIAAGKYTARIYIDNIDKIVNIDNMDNIDNIDIDNNTGCSYDFEVLETPLDVAGFKDKSLYANNKYAAVFAIPDKWTYFEDIKDNVLQVQLTPPSEKMEIGFLFSVNPGIKDFSEEFYQKFADDVSAPFVLDKKLQSVKSTNNSSTTAGGYNYYEIINVFKDGASDEWTLPFCFIEHTGKLYFFYGIVNNDIYLDSSISIFYTMINSLVLQ